ncbi:MAG: L-threonylcarbamoyladenylate synthase [Oscillospiraceae bacterium]
MNTEILSIYGISKKEDIENIEKTVNILDNGGLVAIPTETVYGLAADIYNDYAVKNIYQAKGRPNDNPIIVHVENLEMAKTLVIGKNKLFDNLTKYFWPGPLTLICEKSYNVSSIVSGGLSTVAIRLPQNDIMLNIIKKLKKPLAAPSANLSGAPSPTSSKHVIDDLNGKIDCIIKSYDCKIGLESTVLSIVNNEAILLRPGSITINMIENVIGKIKISENIFKEVSENQKVISPGLKYKHYSPKTNLILVQCNLEKFKFFLKTKENFSLLSFTKELEKNNFPNINIGCLDNENELNKNLFNCLRLIDSLDCKVSYFRLDEKIKNYHAFYNRVLRASGFEVITIE